MADSNYKINFSKQNKMSGENNYFGKIALKRTENVSFLTKPSSATRWKDIGSGCLVSFLVVAFGGAILVGIGEFLAWIGIAKFFRIKEEDYAPWFGLAVFVFGLAWFIYEIISRSKYLVSQCPYCAGLIGTDKFLEIKNQRVIFQCDDCFEYIVQDFGEIRACNQEDMPHSKKDFVAPMFAKGVWPAECVACGKDVTHFDEAQTINFQPAHLLLGRLSVGTASIKNIPYCDAHKDVVKVKVSDKKGQLVFPEWAMQRRYLAINKGKIF
jgi:hypothetical protein